MDTPTTPASADPFARASEMMYPQPSTVPAQPITPAQATYDRLTNESPDSWPEVLREATAVAGAVNTLASTVSELEGRLAHVLTLPPPPDPSVPSPPPFETDSVVGRHLRRTYDEALSAQRGLNDLMRRLAV